MGGRGERAADLSFSRSPCRKRHLRRCGAVITCQSSTMSAKLIPTDLRPIYDKVAAGVRVTDAEALQLYASNDLNSLGTIANLLRERKNGNVATYIHNQYINYSNVCLLACQFCAFGARKRDAHAFEFTADELVEKVSKGLAGGVTEIHMVGGLHPT